MPTTTPRMECKWCFEDRPVLAFRPVQMTDGPALLCAECLIVWRVMDKDLRERGN